MGLSAIRALCVMFNRAIRRQLWMPKYIKVRQRSALPVPPKQAKVRILEATEIKSVPYVLLSHPFAEGQTATFGAKGSDKGRWLRRIPSPDHKGSTRQKFFKTSNFCMDPTPCSCNGRTSSKKQETWPIQYLVPPGAYIHQKN